MGTEPGWQSRMEADVREAGGILKASVLLRLGWRRRDLSAAVAGGTLIRIRKGHYAVPDLPPAAIRAFRVGGRLAGLSALRARGVWTPNRARALSVVVPTNAHGLRRPDDASRRLLPGSVRVHWSTTEAGPGPESAELALRRAAAELAPEHLFAVFESALRAGLLSRAETERLRELFIRTVSPHFARADDAAESGAESVVKFMLLQEGIAFLQQVEIRGVGRVDFLLGRRQILEADGAAYHSSPEDLERDRRREVVAAALGYRTLRCSAKLIESEIELLRDAMQALRTHGDLHS
ncbi:hypothetical protein GCM10025874_13900 [Arenivirga flava]|uniref:DUF559 domain-containing protein n=1 Tax=Arenivirga flava TaxID=1930060 RepID=A0AA37UK54_9MICO|nr:hypothetical protein GCM10025874_13900 [Arenivirga flava]